MGIKGIKKPQPKGLDDGLLAVLPTDSKPWYTKRHLIILNLSILSMVMFSSANGYDGSLMNGLQALDQWQEFMDHPTGAWLGFMNAIYWVGNGINYPISAWVSNKYGRKPGVYVGYFFLVLGVALTAGDHDYYFVLQRFFIGCASAWFSGTVALLINEIAYPTHRGIANALYNCGWYVGGTIGAFVTFGTRNYQSDWSWRIPTVLQILLPLVSLPGFMLAPESPRWLISVDRSEEARKVLERTCGRENPELVNYEMFEITETLRAEQEATSSASYMEMTRTKGNRHRLFISISIAFFSQWAGQGVISYYLPMVLDAVGITSTRDQTLISACMQVWNLVFAVAAALSVDVLGRRFLFLSSAVIMLVGYVITTALSGTFEKTTDRGTGLAVIPFIFIFFAGYDISLTPLVTAYPCEIWPYRLRSRGVTVMGVSVVFSIVFNIFVNPIAMEDIGWKYYIVFIGIIIAYGITAYFWYPETRGHTLEQIANIFDGDEAGVPDAGETAVSSMSVGSGNGNGKGGDVVHEEKV